MLENGGYFANEEMLRQVTAIVDMFFNRTACGLQSGPTTYVASPRSPQRWQPDLGRTLHRTEHAKLCTEICSLAEAGILDMRSV